MSSSTSSISTDDDALERANKQKHIVVTCNDIMQQCLFHIEQFPTTKLDLQKEYDDLRVIWIESYVSTNEEINKADHFSVSDLVFVTICYLLIAINPEWRITPKIDADQDIETILTYVRYVGCQHTQDSMFTWPSASFFHDFKRAVAWIVVYKLSKPMEVKGVGYQLTKTKPTKQSFAESASTAESRIKRISFATHDIDERLKAMQSFALPPVNSEGKFVRPVELGVYLSPVSVTSLFLPQTARIFHGVETEEYILSLYPISKEKPVLAEGMKAQLEKWLLKACSIDSSDDFAADFRKAAFDICLPLNTRINTQTRKQGSSSADVIPLTLLQYELGFDVATIMNEQMSNRVRSIGYDKKHVFYPFIMLQMFGYVMFHEQRVTFTESFYVSQSDLIKCLNTKIRNIIKFRRRREPLIVRLKRKWFIHYTDCITNISQWLECEDAAEVILYWLTLIRDHHDSELISGHNIKEWSKKFLEKNDEIDEEEEDDD